MVYGKEREKNEISLFNNFIEAILLGGKKTKKKHRENKWLTIFFFWRKNISNCHG